MSIYQDSHTGRYYRVGDTSIGYSSHFEAQNAEWKSWDDEPVYQRKAESPPPAYIKPSPSDIKYNHIFICLLIFFIIFAIAAIIGGGIAFCIYGISK